MLGTDGFTAMGQMHGKDSGEKIAELGDTILWNAPVRMRGKLDVRWRYETFSRRIMHSDPHGMGLRTGNVVRAWAMVRVVGNVLWQLGRIDAIKMSSLEERTAINSMSELENTNDLTKLIMSQSLVINKKRFAGFP